MAHLNDKAIRLLPIPLKGRTEHADGKIPGLALWVSSRGTKTFYFKYRLKGAIRRITIGHFPDMPLAEARSRAHQAIVLVRGGQDPARSPAVALKAASEVPRPALIPADITLTNALNDYEELYCNVENKPSTAKEKMRVLRRVFLAAVPDLYLRQVVKADILAVIDPLVKQGKVSAAIHAHANISAFFSWCDSRDMLTVNPCSKLNPPAKKAKREHVLTDEQLGAIWHAAKLEGYPFGTIVQLLMLSLQRRNEVTGMLHSELDYHEIVWAIPRERTKNGVPQHLPMTPRFKAILASLNLTNPTYVFPSRKNPAQAFTGWSQAKRRLDQTVGFRDWTLHDLRRSGASNMAKLKVQPHVIEKILNHVSETFDGVAGIYNQYRYRDEMREALRLWAARLKIITKRHKPDLHLRPNSWQHRIKRPLDTRLKTLAYQRARRAARGA